MAVEPLSTVEARVLGALIEKDITTPDYYPLSLNALVNACNQKNNREPVMEIDEQTVREAMNGLEEKKLAGIARGAEGRVAKFEHHLQEVFNLGRRETAVLCVLLLRGPQTPGELRGRTERMFKFDDLSDVQATLQRMAEHDPPLVTMLARQPGTKEARFAHLLSGEQASWQKAGIESAESVQKSSATSTDEQRIERLEQTVEELRQQLDQLREQLAPLLNS